MERNLYREGTANYPRLRTDALWADYDNRYAYTGFVDQAIRYIEDFQLLRPELWQRFVEQFRHDSDSDAGWRGEYWGKMMRGACFTYAYTRDRKLYDILAQTVRDMMESADADGRISSYGRNHEFDAWDMWSRKYVLLGMQYFLEICDDDALYEQILASMRAQADYIIGKIGDASEGKRSINSCTRNWRGLNASSILEPVVRLYTLTGEQRYLDFAAYIVGAGGTDVENIFELAYKDQLCPYQYPVTKAYEMTSCFEGLLEYYRVTGEEKYRTAVIRFADRILESDFTIIGSCGCTHELFDHSTVRQANTTNGKIAQETCVTVTLMKFFYQLTLLTGDPKYADAFEISLYNAYFGAINTDKVIEPTIRENHPDLHLEPLPFDSYSPLTAGTRGNGVGGLKIMSDQHYYGCCACIGSAGNGLIPKMQLLTARDGFAINLYIAGTARSRTPQGEAVTFETATAYPRDGEIRITLHLEKSEAFALMLRNPAWSKNTVLRVCGETVPAVEGYIRLERTWQDGDVIALTLDMRTQALRPIPYGHDILMNKVIWQHDYVVPYYDVEDPLAAHHIALRRGPIVLAQENRLGYSVDDPVEIAVDADGYVDVALPETDTAPYPHIVEACVPLKNGASMTVTDYASAGKLWTQESKMAAWMLTE